MSKTPELIARQRVEAAEKRGFAHGYLIAVSTMLHQHNCSVTAMDAIYDSGITFREAKSIGLDEFDTQVLWPIYREIERRKRDQVAFKARMS